ncbi:hypothetical protein SAMN04488688_104426 [Paenibacillus sp. cl141a]|uniref:hypothetical protein n=1 Tax=Paenibacillus sp. cl141a TaxID=1761877 RepID=UPI0008B06186|nr:hypothetical protein [Paenibacillus sp. cl141a]SEL56253.1 hypothetical protein SAMN04488688_104426 [Paenibacillus sp. cl141a]
MQIQLSRPPDRRPPYWLPLTTILAVILFISLMLWFEKPPEARKIDAPATEFSAERAMAHVERIAQEHTRWGPLPMRKSGLIWWNR